MRDGHLIVFYGDAWECTCGKTYAEDKDAFNHANPEPPPSYAAAALAYARSRGLHTGGRGQMA